MIAANIAFPTHLKNRRIAIFWMIIIGYIGYYLCRKNLSAALPLMSQDLGYSNTELGIIGSSSEIAYALGKLINGPMADKVGGKKFFLLGMLGAIVMNLVFSFGSSILYFTVAWCICRYFLSMGWGSLAKIAGHWYEPERNGVIMGWISLSFQFGGVVSTLFAGFIAAEFGTWQAVFRYPPIVLFIIMGAAFFIIKNHPKELDSKTEFGHSPSGKKAIVSASMEADNSDGKPLKIIEHLLKLPIYRHVLVFSFLTTFLRSVFFFWTIKFFFDIGMGANQAIFKSALFPFFGCLGTVLLGWYTDNYAKNGDRAKAMWIQLTGLVISLSLVAYLSAQSASPNHTIMVILFCVAGFCLLGPYSMSSGCLTLDIAGPNAAGSATGLIDGLGYIGGALATFMTGYLSDKMGWSGVFGVLAFLALISTISAFMMSKEFQKMNS